MWFFYWHHLHGINLSYNAGRIPDSRFERRKRETIYTLCKRDRISLYRKSFRGVTHPGINLPCVDNEARVVMAVNQSLQRSDVRERLGRTEETPRRSVVCFWISQIRKWLTSIFGVSCWRKKKNNEAHVVFFVFLKIHTFESLFRSHVSSELVKQSVLWESKVTAIEDKVWTMIMWWELVVRALQFFFSFFYPIKSLIGSQHTNSVKSLSIQNLQALFSLHIKMPLFKLMIR